MKIKSSRDGPRIGFTGTQKGMTKAQKKNLADYLIAKWLDHGDCIGADSEAHIIARKKKIGVIIHPPENESKRAFCKGDVFMIKSLTLIVIKKL